VADVTVDLSELPEVPRIERLAPRMTAARLRFLADRLDNLEGTPPPARILSVAIELRRIADHLDAAS